MSTFDPRVWTGDDVPAADASKWFHWLYVMRGCQFTRPKQGAELVSLEPNEARSIHPIQPAEEIAALVECERVLRESKRAHDTCEDSWYSCGAATGDYECSNDSRKGACNCGADAWNAKVDAALARLDAARRERKP